MNTKELATKLDEIQSSIAGHAAEHAVKIDRAVTLLRELHGLSGDRLWNEVNTKTAEMILGGVSGPRWKSDARGKALELLGEWMKANGLDGFSEAQKLVLGIPFL